jgi:probable HAF family extracellular repeat protein
MKRLLTFVVGVLVLLSAQYALAAEIVQIPMQVPSISANGEWFVGREGSQIQQDGDQATIWSRQLGLRRLGVLPGHVRSGALGVSPDGSVVVGVSRSSSSGEAFRWTAESGMIGLGTLPEAPSTRARGVSADGSVIAGDSAGEPWIWTQRDGMRAIGRPAGTASVPSIKRISQDGRVVVGYARTQPAPQGNNTVFLWDQQTGFQDLGALPPGWVGTVALGMSSDGSTVLGGLTEAGNGSERGAVFRWTRDLGIVPLPVLPGTQKGFALSATPNGSLIIGEMGDTPSTTLAFVWDELHGTQNLRQVLIDEHGFTDAQLPLLNSAADISADAKTLIGTTFNIQNGSIASRAHWGIFLDKPLINVVPEPSGALLGCTAALVLVVALLRRRSLSRMRLRL